MVTGLSPELLTTPVFSGRENLKEAMEPFYTTKPDEERSGMGFTVIQTFMEDVKIISEVNKGTTVIMNKTIACK